MFDSLQDKLDKAFHILKGQGQISEINVAETVKEIRRALVDADVSYKIARDFTNTIKQKALGQEVLNSLNPGQLMTKIVRDEITELMGRSAEELNLESNPSIILMVGLQGSGKTTHSVKLAHYLNRRKNKRPLLVACDIYRPAAINQLKVMGEQAGIEIYAEEDNKDPVQIAENALGYAKSNDFHAVIIDTAGRLAIDRDMMDEIQNIHRAIEPNETLFVVDAMTGQDAVNTAKTFNDVMDYEGVILTKLDGDTRGGAALTIRSIVQKPIKFIGTGENIDTLDVFYPDRMADRILGMGDVVSLVERAQEQYDEEEARRVQKKIAVNKFDFNDFIRYIKQIEKMGSMKNLIEMIPGIGKMMKNIDIDDSIFKGIESIIQSMTPRERENPKIIKDSRKKRLADGSGVSIQEVNQLLKQFNEMNKMMRMMQSDGKRFTQMMKGMKGERPF